MTTRTSDYMGWTNLNEVKSVCMQLQSIQHNLDELLSRLNFLVEDTPNADDNYTLIAQAYTAVDNAVNELVFGILALEEVE